LRGIKLPALCDAASRSARTRRSGAGDPLYVIDPLKCTKCVGAHDRLVCPSDCIVQHPDCVETPEQLAEK
jgi:hypothetical protein